MTHLYRQQQQRTRSSSPSSPRLVPAAVLTAAWAAASLVTTASIARANTYSWTGTTGNFSTAANWGGTAPNFWTGTDTFVFGTDNAYTATDNVYSSATRRESFQTGLIFNDSSPVTITATGLLPTAPAAEPTGIAAIAFLLPFRFVTDNGLIDQQGAGTVNIMPPITVGMGASLTIQAEPGSGQLTIANETTPTTLADSYQIQGEGTINVNNLSSNPILLANMGQFTGNLNILAGTATAADSINTALPGGGTGSGGGDVISSQTLITVSPGATYDFNANGEIFGGFAGGGNIAMGSTGGLTLQYSQSDLTFTGNITQAANTLGTAGGVTKDLGSGHTTYTWTGNAQQAGTTTINAGTMMLSGGGQFSATKAVVVANNANLVLDNTSQNLSGRINPDATLNVSGSFTINGAPGAATNETVSQLIIGGPAGEGSVNLNNGASGGTTTLTAGTLTTAIGGFVNFTGNGSVYLTNAPTLTNGIIGQSTVNYTDWATIDPNNGNKIIALPAASYQTSTDPATWQSTDNVKVTATLGGSADIATSSINSLVLASPNAAVNINTSLSLNSGGILAANSGTISGGQINSAATNGQLTMAVPTGRTLTVNSNIVDGPLANVLVKTGPGTLVLNGTNTYSSGTVLQNGTLSVASDAALGTGPLTLNGGTLQFTNSVTTTKSLSLSGLDSVIDTGSNTVTFNGGVFGSGNGSLTKIGSGSLVLLNNSDPSITNTGIFNSSGNMNILQGTVVTAAGNSYSGSTNLFVAAGAVADLSYDTSSEGLGTISGGGTIYMQGATSGISLDSGSYTNVTFSGVLAASINGVPGASTVAGLTKSGVGTITLTGPSTYGGPTKVQSGTVIVGADAMPNQDGPLGNASTEIQIGFTPGGSADESSVVAPIGLMIGTPGVTIGRDLHVYAGTNANWGTMTGTLSIGTTYPSGTSTFSGAIALARTLEINVAGTGSTSVTGAVTGSGNLIKDGTGSVVISNSANTYSGGLVVESGNATVTALAAGGKGPWYAAGGTLVAQAGMSAQAVQLGQPSAITITGLAISNVATVDLNDNDLIVTYSTSPLAKITAAINNAYSNGTWSGTGLTSSAAKTGGIETLAAVDAVAAGITTFDGTAVTKAILVKYTYFGDLNLDGKINADDYALIDRGAAKGLTGWQNGDINYDGIINSADYLLMDTAFGRQSGMLSSGFLATREAMFGESYVTSLVAAVPEPASLGLLLAAGASLMTSRRSRRRHQ